MCLSLYQERFRSEPEMITRKKHRYRTVIRKNTGPEYGQKKKRTIGQWHFAFGGLSRARFERSRSGFWGSLLGLCAGDVAVKTLGQESPGLGRYACICTRGAISQEARRHDWYDRSRSSDPSGIFLTLLLIISPMGKTSWPWVIALRSVDRKVC